MTKYPIKTLLSGSVALMMFFTLLSCSKTVRFQTSSVVPAAVASVKLSKDVNKNNEIEIKVTNLADPGRLTPPRKTYVVWMQTESNGVKNIGQLISETSYFSSGRKAELVTTTPFQPERIFVTAEDNANVMTPGGQQVLSTDKF